jgi:FKBP-type peptidyl-prolyl cis-trans isomerase FklB
MKRASYVIFLLNWIYCAAAADGAALDSQASKAGYALGWQFMNSLKDDDLELDSAAFLQGLEDSRQGGAARLPPEELGKGIDYFTAMRAIKRKALRQQTESEGKAFLERNRARDGVTTLASGLQYQVLQSGGGDGGGPADGDGVALRYRISDIHERELGKSGDEQPRPAPMSTLIPGWREALKLMKPGDRWLLYVPPDLGYGDKPVNKRLKPNQTLVTELELLAVTPADQMKQPEAKAEAKPVIVPGSEFRITQ